MSENILRYTDLAAAIQLARSAGLSTADVIRALTRGMTHREAQRLAAKAAPLLDITSAEFMRLRKNG